GGEGIEESGDWHDVPGVARAAQGSSGLGRAAVRGPGGKNGALVAEGQIGIFHHVPWMLERLRRMQQRVEIKIERFARSVFGCFHSLSRTNIDTKPCRLLAAAAAPLTALGDGRIG